MLMLEAFRQSAAMSEAPRSRDSRILSSQPTSSGDHAVRPSLLLLACILLLTATAAGQETPTERSAAADVIRRMNELEASLQLPAMVSRLSAPDPRRAAVMARAKALMDQELLAMADDITKHPEVGCTRRAR